jgi:fructose-1-phosphate kinase PfkB-like protein
MVGAFAWRWLATGDLHDAMRWGVAAGAANAGQVLSAFCERMDIEPLVGQVEVTKIARSA